MPTIRSCDSSSSLSRWCPSVHEASPSSSCHLESPVPYPARRVEFDVVRTRCFERILGDHPSCSNGAPIAIGWHYDPQEECCSVTEHVERLRIRRSAPQYSHHRETTAYTFALTKEDRHELLLQWGFSNAVIVSTVRKNLQIKRQRRQTFHNSENGYDRWEAAMEKVSRKVKKSFFLGGSRSDNKQLLPAQQGRQYNALVPTADTNTTTVIKSALVSPYIRRKHSIGSEQPSQNSSKTACMGCAPPQQPAHILSPPTRRSFASAHSASESSGGGSCDRVPHKPSRKVSPVPVLRTVIKISKPQDESLQQRQDCSALAALRLNHHKNSNSWMHTPQGAYSQTHQDNSKHYHSSTGTTATEALEDSANFTTASTSSRHALPSVPLVDTVDETDQQSFADNDPSSSTINNEDYDDDSSLSTFDSKNHALGDSLSSLEESVRLSPRKQAVPLRMLSHQHENNNNAPSCYRNQ